MKGCQLKSHSDCQRIWMDPRGGRDVLYVRLKTYSRCQLCPIERFNHRFTIRASLKQSGLRDTQSEHVVIPAADKTLVNDSDDIIPFDASNL